MQVGFKGQNVSGKGFILRHGSEFLFHIISFKVGMCLVKIKISDFEFYFSW